MNICIYVCIYLELSFLIFLPFTFKLIAQYQTDPEFFLRVFQLLMSRLATFSKLCFIFLEQALSASIATEPKPC